MYECQIAESADDFGEVRFVQVEANSPQEAYDKAAKEGYVIDVADAMGSCVVPNMWQ